MPRRLAIRPLVIDGASELRLRNGLVFAHDDYWAPLGATMDAVPDLGPIYRPLVRLLRGGDFSHGMAPVALANRSRDRQYTDRQGNVLFPGMKLREAKPFSEGWAPMGGPFGGDDPAGYIDAEGQRMDLSELLDPERGVTRLSEVGQFRDGLAPVWRTVDPDSGLAPFLFVTTDGSLGFIPEEELGVLRR